MKKTQKTLLTAAILTAAVSFTACDGGFGFYCVYGPPPDEDNNRSSSEVVQSSSPTADTELSGVDPSDTAQNSDNEGEKECSSSE